jgi:hypothetical protein
MTTHINLYVVSLSLYHLYIETKKTKLRGF